MKWYDVKEKLPPTHQLVMVCREIRIPGMNFVIQSHDIGMLEGTGAYDRWRLESQQYSPLPTKPTIESGIITHWQRLPKFPPKKEEE